MKGDIRLSKRITPLLAISTAMLACSLLGGSGSEPNTPAEAGSTPTPTQGGAVPIGQGPCDGISGNLEMQVLVGPSDVAGLEPVAVGNLPFSVSPAEGGYQVQGGGILDYQDVLEADWGTYTVSMNMQAEISGNCFPSGEQANLSLTVSAEGEQLLEVRADGFQGDYPWEGSHQLDLDFPLEDGAQAQGEGWVFTLHLDPQASP